jgi:hypothetical protein
MDMAATFPRKSNQTWNLFNLVNFHQSEEIVLKS